MLTLCFVQALEGFHAQGRGECDLKPDNLMIQVADDGSFLDCHVLDLSGSAAHKGQSHV